MADLLQLAELKAWYDPENKSLKDLILSWKNTVSSDL